MWRKTLLEAETDARQAITRLVERKAECIREHHSITPETQLVRGEMRKTFVRIMQNQEGQVAKMDEMGYRIAEITDTSAQRE